MSMKKRIYQTTFTPIPFHVPRQLAIDLLHNHSEIIALHPLVIEHHPTKAPQNAAPDELYSTWYEITQRIQIVPGVGGAGSGKITFKTVFHNMRWGLQTHTYAVAGIDLRHRYTIGGNQPGEPHEVRELGAYGAPAEGLYLREEVEIRCNVLLANFVKKELKAATSTLIERLIKKAELVDAGFLHAMMEDGMLRTTNPAIDSHLPQYPGLAPPEFTNRNSWRNSSMWKKSYHERPLTTDQSRASELPTDVQTHLVLSSTATQAPVAVDHKRHPMLPDNPHLSLQKSSTPVAELSG